jgi:hypothetical protein
VGYVVDKVALEQVFSEYFGLPCQFSFHRLSVISPGAGTIGQIVADVPSGLSRIPPDEIKRKLKITSSVIFFIFIDVSNYKDMIRFLPNIQLAPHDCFKTNIAIEVYTNLTRLWIMIVICLKIFETDTK